MEVWDQTSSAVSPCISYIIEAAYFPIIGSLGIWKYKERKTLFNLCVDDFGIKHYSTEDLLYLQSTLQKFTV